MNKKVLMMSLGLYLVTSLVSFSAFSFFAPKTVSLDSTTDPASTGSELGSLLTLDPSEPRDQVCPLNGKMFTQKEKTAWEAKRPLAVMIENSPDARPQAGLSDADVVFEALAEGGVTRFMALFYCGVQVNDTTLAPIRSARTYFVDWASGFNYPLYVHVGGANLPGPTDALGQINTYGWALENDLNQFSIGYPTFVRNENRLGKRVATEHTMETTTEKLWEVATDREWTNISPKRTIGRQSLGGDDWKAGYAPWTFAEGKAGSGTVNAISYEFWSGYAQYGVSWAYDSTTNTYKRTLAGEPHTDINNDKQLAVSNVIVLFTKEQNSVNELKHTLYTTVGTGDILVFQNGTSVKGTWSKKSREAELTFLDTKGNPLPLVRGQIWISVLDTATDVTY